MSIIDAWLYDKEEVIARLLADPNDHEALNAMGDIVKYGIYPIDFEPINIIGEGQDGTVYSTDNPVLAVKSGIDIHHEAAIGEKLHSRIMARIYGIHNDVLVEERIYGPTLKDLDHIISYDDFMRMYTILAYGYNLGPKFMYNHRDLHSGNLMLAENVPGVKYYPKIVDQAFAWYRDSGDSTSIISKRGRGLPDRFIPLLDLYRVLIRSCYVNRWDSSLLRFFDLTLDTIVPVDKWIIPMRYWNTTLPEYLDFMRLNSDIPRFVLPSVSYTPIPYKMTPEKYATIPDDIRPEIDEKLETFFTPSVDVLTQSDIEQNELIMYRNADALNKYTKHYDRVINKELRNKRVSCFSSKLIHRIIQTLDETTPINHSYTLYRGTGYDPFSGGNLFTDYGFMSKTSDITIAGNFTGDSGVILAIKYPPGTRQLYIDPISEHAEKEFLTYPGETIRFIKQTVDVYDTLILSCEFVSENHVYHIDEGLDGVYEKLFNPLLKMLYKTRYTTFYLMLANPDLYDSYDKDEFYSLIPNDKRITVIPVANLYSLLYARFSLETVVKMGIVIDITTITDWPLFVNKVHMGDPLNNVIKFIRVGDTMEMVGNDR